MAILKASSVTRDTINMYALGSCIGIIFIVTNQYQKYFQLPDISNLLLASFIIFFTQRNRKDFFRKGTQRKTLSVLSVPASRQAGLW